MTALEFAKYKAEMEKQAQSRIGAILLGLMKELEQASELVPIGLDLEIKTLQHRDFRGAHRFDGVLLSDVQVTVTMGVPS